MCNHNHLSCYNQFKCYNKFTNAPKEFHCFNVYDGSSCVTEFCLAFIKSRKGLNAFIACHFSTVMLCS